MTFWVLAAPPNPAQDPAHSGHLSVFAVIITLVAVCCVDSRCQSETGRPSDAGRASLVTFFFFPVTFDHVLFREDTKVLLFPLLAALRQWVETAF